MSNAPKHVEAINEMLKSAYIVGDMCHGIDFYGHSVEECAEAYVTHINDGFGVDPATEARKLILSEITRLTVENMMLRDALSKLLQRDQRNTCHHENTHRGGFIWEICDDCGAKWADDCGGKPEWKDPQEWVDAEAILAVKHD